jgi:hypothetical protein
VCEQLRGFPVVTLEALWSLCCSHSKGRLLAGLSMYPMVWVMQSDPKRAKAALYS